jgi:hypothetical protein
LRWRGGRQLSEVVLVAFFIKVSFLWKITEAFRVLLRRAPVHKFEHRPFNKTNPHLTIAS